MRHLAHIVEIYSELWLENNKGRDHLRDLGIDERIILK
jgi:hypothetical protein